MKNKAARTRKFKRDNAKATEQEPICIVGRNACLALFEKRPEDIRKVSLCGELKEQFRNVLEWCTNKARPYQVVANDELDRIAGGTHHEGVAILANAKPAASLKNVLARKPHAAVFLSDVGNPHNVGAILRVCAFYGVDAVFIAGESAQKLSSAAIRIAQGGAELVDIVSVKDSPEVFSHLRENGFTIVTTSPHAKKALPKLPRIQRPLFVFGSENSGLSTHVLREGLYDVSLPGCGKLESLNVACSVSVVLSHFWHQSFEVFTG